MRRCRLIPRIGWRKLKGEYELAARAPTNLRYGYVRAGLSGATASAIFVRGEFLRTRPSRWQ